MLRPFAEPFYDLEVSRIAQLSVALGALLTIVSFAALCKFASPQMDDYMIAAHNHEYGLWGAQTRWYLDWHGKYWGMLCMSTFAWAFDIVDEYWLAPALVLSATAFGCMVLVRAICARAPVRRVYAIATVLFALVLANVPQPQESIFWMTGAYAYQVGVVCAMSLIAVCASSVRRRWHVGVGVLLAFAIAGSSETLMLPAAVVATSWLCAAVFGRVRWTSFGVCIATAVLFGGAVMLFAPGNAVRATHFGDKSHDLVRTLTRSFERASGHGALWVIHPTILGASLIAAGPLHAFAVARGIRLGGLSSFAAFVLLAISFFPAYWATGYGPPGRAMAVVWAVFAFGWFFIVVPTIVAKWSTSRLLRWNVAQRHFGPLLLAVGLVVPGNTLTALQDLTSGEAQAFHDATSSRDARLRSCRGAENVVVETIGARPRSLFVDDLSTDASHGINVEAARYFGIGALRRR